MRVADVEAVLDPLVHDPTLDQQQDENAERKNKYHARLWPWVMQFKLQAHYARPARVSRIGLERSFQVIAACSSRFGGRTGTGAIVGHRMTSIHFVARRPNRSEVAGVVHSTSRAFCASG